MTRIWRSRIAATFAIIAQSQLWCPAVLFKCESCASSLLPWHLAQSKGKHRPMATLDDLYRALVTAKDCTNDEVISLKQRLSTHNVPDLHAISKWLSVKLSGVVRKADIVERLVCVAPSWAAFAEMKQTVL